jgi:hypothetical protein
MSVVKVGCLFFGWGVTQSSFMRYTFCLRGFLLESVRGETALECKSHSGLLLITGLAVGSWIRVCVRACNSDLFDDIN